MMPAGTVTPRMQHLYAVEDEHLRTFVVLISGHVHLNACRTTPPRL